MLLSGLGVMFILKPPKNHFISGKMAKYYYVLLHQYRLDGDESVTCGGLEAMGVWSATSPLCQGNAYP